MKKLISLLLIVILINLAGCSAKEEPKKSGNNQLIKIENSNKKNDQLLKDIETYFVAIDKIDQKYMSKGEVNFTPIVERWLNNDLHWTEANTFFSKICIPTLKKAANERDLVPIPNGIEKLAQIQKQMGNEHIEIVKEIRALIIADNKDPKKIADLYNKGRKNGLDSQIELKNVIEHLLKNNK